MTGGAHRPWSIAAVLGAVLVCSALSVAGPAFAQLGQPEDDAPFDPRCPTATPERAQALAERAARFLEKTGPGTALRRFTARDGGFVKGDLYVFVFDLDGMLVASGGWPQTVGSTVIVGDDGGRTGIFTRMRALALSKGRGWVHYHWYSPCTRSMQPKMTYIIRVGRYIVGVGTYKVGGV